MSQVADVVVPARWSVYFNGELLTPEADFTVEHEVDSVFVVLDFHLFRGESFVVFKPDGAALVRVQQERVYRGTRIRV